MKTIVLIPARMASTRLPGKALADIAGSPMIVHVARRAREADVGEVVVATDTSAIAAAVEAAGFRAVLTGDHHQSGSDRIHEALGLVDPDGAVECIVNIQGDLPSIDPAIIARSVEPLGDPDVDIGTLGVEITDDEERTNPNVVKIIGSPVAADRLRALYFSRATAPCGEGPLYHHIGLYSYRRAALDRFVGLAPSTLEKREKLEQLRALEAGMRIDAMIVDTAPLGVDTQDHLDRARRLLG